MKAVVPVQAVIQDSALKFLQTVTWIHQREKQRKRRTTTERKGTTTRDPGLLQGEDVGRGSYAEVAHQAKSTVSGRRRNQCRQDVYD